MVERKLVPYSVYISQEHYLKLKDVAKSRRAASLVRDAIGMILDGKDTFNAGYNKGIKDACKVVFECPEAQMVAVKGKDIGVYLSEQIKLLEQK